MDSLPKTRQTTQQVSSQLLAQIAEYQMDGQEPRYRSSKQVYMPSIHTLLRKTQLHWAGHVARMPEHRMPKRIFYSELAEGARQRGGQKKRYKDTRTP